MHIILNLGESLLREELKSESTVDNSDDSSSRISLEEFITPSNTKHHQMASTSNDSSKCSTKSGVKFSAKAKKLLNLREKRRIQAEDVVIMYFRMFFIFFSFSNHKREIF